LRNFFQKEDYNMPRLSLNDQRAFTLLEILAALGIVAVIFFFVTQLGHFFRAQSDVSDIRSRMEEIVDTAKAYYLNQGDLPVVPAGGGIPLAPTGFDIDPKLRFDSWQRPMQYVSYTNDGVDGRPGEIQIDPLEPGAPAGSPVAMVVIPAGSRTLLRAIDFEGRLVAGLFISSGPDQVFSYTVTPGYPEVYVSDPASDDIILPIDLTEEAIQIALPELKVLNDKVSAFDDRYLGVDNDGDNPPRFDEAGCDGIPYGFDVTFINPSPVADCSTVSFGAIEPTPPSTSDDISCGKPTLDYMKANFCPQPWGISGGCPPGYYSPARDEIGIVTDTLGDVCPGFDVVRPERPTSYASIGTCYWGLVETQYGDAAAPDPNETDGDQARAFISCLFALGPEAVVDPWLNGYVWGCGASTTLDANGVVYGGCQYVYPVGDPHYRRFFSAGPDGMPALLEAQIETTPAEQAATDDIIL
jgi:prepilin-type N-terminal cleavage/methylation domain-containing protein